MPKVREVLGVGDGPMVGAVPEKFSSTNCNAVVGLKELPVLRLLDDSSGLPILSVRVNGLDCSILLGTGSKLNLVSNSFLVDRLKLDSSNIRPTSIMVRGVSGNVFQAAGELDLSFSLVDRTFRFRFVVLNNKTFPADLLLSYNSIKDLLFPEGAVLSLTTSDYSRVSNTANLPPDESVMDVQTGSTSQLEGRFDGSPRPNLGKATESAPSDPLVPAEEVAAKEVMLLQYITGEEFFRFKQDQEVSGDHSCSVYDVINSREWSSECCYAEVKDSSEFQVGLVAIDDDKSVHVRTLRDVALVPDRYTKVYLRCEDVDNNEVLVLGDKPLHPDVCLETAVVSSENGNFFVYAMSNNGMTVSLDAGTLFCYAVVLENRLVAFDYDVFPCLNAAECPDKLTQELEVSDYPEATES